jgi:hypothetical protein
MSIPGQKRKSSSALDGTPRLTTRVGDCDPTPYRRKDVLFGGTHEPQFPKRFRKMGAIVSPWRFDAAAGDALKLAGLRCSAIPHYASWIPKMPGR